MKAVPVQRKDTTHMRTHCTHPPAPVINVLRQVPMRAGGEQGMASGEQGTESTSLILSSADDVSDRRDSSGGARLLDKVRTRGEPQSSSQPLSTVWADFCRRVGTHGVLKGKRQQSDRDHSMHDVNQYWFFSVALRHPFASC